ncbi:MAG: hypothetical protein RIQ88_179 [Actinomycetota bacterium]|jgi:signal peptidase I
MAKKNIWKKWLSGFLAAIFVLPLILNLFGVISLKVVLTDSMSPIIKPGDLVVSANWMKPGLKDIGLYHERDVAGNYKQDVIHRVVTITADKQYQFKGDNNQSIDALVVPEKDVVGKVVANFTGVGNLYTPLGMLSVVSVIAGIWLVVVGVRRLRNK